jgi:ribulose-phosphate 3-epimerase
MDNHYVPNLTIGPLVCRALRDYGIQAPLDVHLMAKPVDNLIPAFAKAGASFISFHPEASEHIHRTLQLIREYGCKPGLAFNPTTPLHYLDYLIEELDQVLIMSVNPGFGGQQFLPMVLPKISEARQRIARCKQPIRLEVDGGINTENIAEIARAGADTFVAGAAIFQSEDYAKTIHLMRQRLQQHAAS